MRHRNSHRKFGREVDHRLAMLNNQLKSLVEYGFIKTTEAKAKETRVMIEKLITLGKKGTVSAQRLAYERLQDRDLVYKLFHVISKRYTERPGGYTRIFKIGYRPGDAAPLAIIELV